MRIEQLFVNSEPFAGGVHAFICFTFFVAQPMVYRTIPRNTFLAHLTMAISDAIDKRVGPLRDCIETCGKHVDGAGHATYSFKIIDIATLKAQMETHGTPSKTWKSFTNSLKRYAFDVTALSAANSFCNGTAVAWTPKTIAHLPVHFANFDQLGGEPGGCDDTELAVPNRSELGGRSQKRFAAVNLELHQKEQECIRLQKTVMQMNEEGRTAAQARLAAQTIESLRVELGAARNQNAKMVETVDRLNEEVRTSRVRYDAIVCDMNNAKSSQQYIQENMDLVAENANAKRQLESALRRIDDLSGQLAQSEAVAEAQAAESKKRILESENMLKRTQEANKRLCAELENARRIQTQLSDRLTAAVKERKRRKYE